jgi:hypothetical protein
MTREDILRMARECFADPDGSLALLTPELTEFATLVAAAEQEKLAHWMRSMGYATGHGDTIEDLLGELRTQIAEKLLTERAACADICDQHASVEGIAQRCAAEIRARNKT